ncbi:hypothetical protein V6Z11_A06G133000 [Gossypium hirsutum]
MAQRNINTNQYLLLFQVHHDPAIKQNPLICFYCNEISLKNHQGYRTQIFYKHEVCSRLILQYNGSSQMIKFHWASSHISKHFHWSNIIYIYIHHNLSPWLSWCHKLIRHQLDLGNFVNAFS